MKGLLTKDFLTVKKKYGITRLIMDLAIIAALMIILEGAGSIYISFLLVPLEVASMLITLANSDEQWKWGKYAVALPISKRQIVSSRYAFGGIAAIIGLCVALVVNTISYFCFPAYQFGFYLFLSIASFCMVLLFLAFILPSNYWLGVNAGFAVMFILIILLVVLGIWSRMTNNAIMGFVVDNFDLSMAIGFVSTIVIFALSYILSVGLFKRKYAEIALKQGASGEKSIEKKRKAAIEKFARELCAMGFCDGVFLKQTAITVIKEKDKKTVQSASYAYTPYGDGKAGEILYTAAGKYRFQLIRLAEFDATGAYAEQAAKIIDNMNGNFIKERFYAIPLESLPRVNSHNAKPRMPFYHPPHTDGQK